MPFSTGNPIIFLDSFRFDLMPIQSAIFSFSAIQRRYMSSTRQHYIFFRRCFVYRIIDRNDVWVDWRTQEISLFSSSQTCKLNRIGNEFHFSFYQNFIINWTIKKMFILILTRLCIIDYEGIPNYKNSICRNWWPEK